MNTNNNITLGAYAEKARKQYADIENRLSTAESSFQTRMNGKSTGRIVGAIFVTFIWLAAFIAGAIYVRDMVHPYLLLATAVITVGLILFMLIDSMVNLSYYGKITKYKNSFSQLRNRVNIGKSSVQKNNDAFMDAKSRGWNYPLTPAPSITDEAAIIMTTMAGMESLKSKFLSRAKYYLFFLAVLLITVTGCMALFPVGGKIMTGISGKSLSDNTIQVLNIIAMVIVCIGAVILARLLFVKTNFSVTNVTLFATLAGPVAFLALIALATLIVLLALGVVSLIISIISVVVAGACLYGTVCGG